MRLVHLVQAGAVLAALGVIAGAARLTHPAAPRPDSAAAVTRQVAVTSAVRACPPAQGNGSGPVALIAGAATATGAAGPATAGQAGQTGQVELTALPQAGVPLRAAGPIGAQTPGVLSLLTVPAGSRTPQEGRLGGGGLVGVRERHHGPGHGGRSGPGLQDLGQRPLRRAPVRTSGSWDPDSRTAQRRSSST